MEQFQISEEVLVTYLKGELDTEDAAQVETWYDASATNRKMLGEVYYLLFLNDRLNETARIDVERSLRDLKARIHSQNRPTNPFRRNIWRVAVAAVLAFALGTGIWETSSIAERLSKPVKIFTQLGERSQVVLPDGTKVWLNSCSHVEYTSPLFSNKRLVTMDGEAYFEIAHNEEAPFIVSTNGLNVRVLGTKFNIRNDHHHHRITTVLLEGAVEAYTSADIPHSIHLQPSQSAVYDTQTGHLVLADDTEAENSINWIEGRLHFDRQPFSEITTELQRYYNVDITFRNDALKNECFSGDFQVSDGIYHIMSVLGLTYKFRYEIVGDDIILHAN